MVLKVFTKKDDPNIEDVLSFTQMLEDEGQSIEYYDFDAAESHQLAEIFEIFKTPSFVVTQDDGREVYVWRGEIPSTSDLTNFLSV